MLNLSIARLSGLFVAIACLMASSGCSQSGPLAVSPARFRIETVDTRPNSFDGLYGFADKAGTVIIKPIYRQADDFSEGLAAAMPNNGKLLGYLNPDGSWAIKPAYDSAEPFSEGLALVSRNNKSFYVDTRGNVAFTLEKDVVEGSSFSEGLAMIDVGVAGKEGQKCGAIDPTGRRVIPPIYDSLGNYKDGLALFTQGTRFGYINKTGKVQFLVPHGELISNFSEGLASVRIDNRPNHNPYEGLFGFINEKGEMVIPPTFQMAGNFQEGLAPIDTAQGPGYVDKSGKVVIQLPEIMDSVMNSGFSEGLAYALKGNKFGYINHAGAFIIPPKYDCAASFKNGLAFVGILDVNDNSKSRGGYIDHTGKVIIPFQYQPGSCTHGEDEP